MGESKEKLLKAIKHYQDSLERHGPKGNCEKLLHAIEKLSKLPIKVCHLEETGVGRTVNSLKKIGGEVGENARILVDKWKSMVKVEEDADLKRVEKEALQKQQESQESDESEDSDEDPEPNKLQICDPESSDNEGVRSNNSKSSPRTNRSVNDNMERYSKESKSHSKHSHSSKRRRSSEKRDSNSSEDDSDHHKSKKHKSDKQSRKSSKHSRYKRRSDSSESDTYSECQSESENEKSSENEEISEREKKSKKHSSHKKDKEREDKYSKHKADSRDKKENKERSSKERKEDKRSNSKSKDGKYKEAKREKEKDLTVRKDSHRSDEKKHSKDNEKSRETSKSDKHKKRDGESSYSEKNGKKSSSERKESTSKSSKGSSEAKKDKDKDRHKSDSGKATKEKEKPKIRTEKLVNGIDSESGTSFADALGMLEAPVYVSSKKKTTAGSSKERKSPERAASKEEKGGKSSGAGISSSRVASDAGNSKDEVPKLLTDKNNLEPLDINISTLLPSITPNYKPLGFPVDGQSRRMWTDDEALSRVISAKHQRTKVYSGNKASYTKVPSLFDLCTRILQDNIDALEYTGGVPYSILKPILEKANPDQLYQLEFHNAYLVEDTDELWQLHCQREFRTKRREELESWREMYMRCLDEREAKLKALTANIKQSQDKSLPVRTTKLAYVDSYVKPPRNVARKQAKNGTAIEIKRPFQTPSERLNQLAKGGESGKVAMPNPGRQAVERSSSSHSHSSNLKPKKAPLMAKTLSLLKNRFGRR